MYRLAKSVEEKGLSGAIVECGVWKGGCAGVAAAVVREGGHRRELHLFDSFQGLPEPSGNDGQEAAEYSDGRANGKLESTGKCVAAVSEVEELLFRRLAIDPTKVKIHVGWFQDTIPNAAKGIGPIAVLRLDGDWYESTSVCLKYLYPLISPGGIVILDDYNFWEGCAKATNEYRSQFSITTPIERIDAEAVFWRIPKDE